MKPNDIVMIYSDPVNCLNPEGQAKLIIPNLYCTKLHYINAGYEYWDVEFLDQPDKLYPRLIKTS